jgi:hypothetical protein
LLKPRESVQLGEYYGPAPRIPAIKQKTDPVPDVSLPAA